MDRRPSDLRILKLAWMYERAYEAFVREMADEDVHGPAARRNLAALAAATKARAQRIATEIDRLGARPGAMEPASVERGALQNVLEVERAARAFYLRFVEEAHDPGVAGLLLALAREAGHRVRVAEEALTMVDRTTGRVHVGSATAEVIRVLREAPGREGMDAGRI